MNSRLSVTLCIILHAVLVLIYAAIVVIDVNGLYNKPLQIPQGTFRTVIAIASQAFTIIYCAALVLLTQRITLNESSKRRQTLTSIHDKTSAWLGLGTSLLTLGRQAKLATDVLGIFMITTYLLLIFVVHTTLPSIFGVSTQNVTINAVHTTILARQNATSELNGATTPQLFSSGSTNVSLSNLYSILQVYDSLDLPTVGVLDNTLYDIIPSTKNAADIGVEVNATTFSVDCASLPDADQIYFVDPEDADPFYIFGFADNQYAVYLSVMGLNQFQVLPVIVASNDSDSNGMPPNMLVVATTYPMVDSAGGNATSASLNPSWVENTQFNTNNNITLSSISLMGCNFGSHNSTVLVDPQSRTVDQPSAAPSPARWHEWTDPGTGGDPLLMDNLQAFVNNIPSFVSAPNLYPIALENGTFSGSSSVDTPSILEQFLQIDISTSRNTSLDTSGPVTVGELNWSLARAYSAVLWYYNSVSATSLNVAFSNGGDERLQGQASIPTSVLQDRVTINKLSLFAGLGASGVLFVLVSFMIIRSGGRSKNAIHYDITGVLPILWLLGSEPELASIEEPDTDALRVAGMYEVTGRGRLRRPADSGSGEKQQYMETQAAAVCITRL
ncbi:hypothetical protein NM688_g1774 [Phlebia brevispora]|uniref:Uncharacterized protein n=1 Tax=Phlebia brevispora TaxID=194682 RepID=A0ACC1TAD1_9APHY|nr:hypothetical protein NM688_g1774 [Phlebia brevispora]